MAWYDDPLTVTAVAVVIIAACGVVIFAMRRTGPKGLPSKNPQKPRSMTSDLGLIPTSAPFKISKSVQASTASTAKDELRMLDLERDILVTPSAAFTRLKVKEKSQKQNERSFNLPTPQGWRQLRNPFRKTNP